MITTLGSMYFLLCFFLQCQKVTKKETPNRKTHTERNHGEHTEYSSQRRASHRNEQIHSPQQRTDRTEQKNKNNNKAVAFKSTQTEKRSKRRQKKNKKIFTDLCSGANIKECVFVCISVFVPFVNNRCCYFFFLYLNSSFIRTYNAF